MLAQAMAAADRAHTAAEAETTRRAHRVSVLQAQLRELSSADSPQAQALYAQIQRQLVDAEQSLEVARQATWRTAEVTRQVAGLQRSHARTAEASVSAARGISPAGHGTRRVPGGGRGHRNRGWRRGSV